MGWYFDHYQVGKHRQWVGAPIPIRVSYKQAESLNFARPEKRGGPPRPLLRVDDKSVDFEFEREGSWIVVLDTKTLGSGRHELIFELDERTRIHASDEPLFLLDPDEYRRELAEEADETFLPSPGLWDFDQVERLMRTLIGRDVHSAKLDMKKGLMFPKPIASAPVYWAMHALITEFVYLSTSEPETIPAFWGFEMQQDVLDLYFHMFLSRPPNEEIAASVKNPKLGLLHLLNGSHKQRTFEPTTELSSEDARLGVKFHAYEAPIQQ